MTATATPPSPAATTPPSGLASGDGTAGSPDARPPSAGRTPGVGPLASEITLASVTVVAVLSFLRLFADAGAVLPLLVAAALAHLVCALTCRAGLGTWPALAIVAGCAVLEISLVLYPHTSFAGIPSHATFTALGHDMDRAWTAFGEVVAPAPRPRGFLLAATVGIWVAVTLADWAGLRLRATAEAVLPMTSMFIFCAILGAGGGAVVLAVLLIAAVAAFALAQRIRHATTDQAWVGGRSRFGAAASARTGCLIVAVVAVLAGLAAPRLPWATSAPLVDVQGGDGPQSRVTISPLVDIRSRLVHQADTTVFTVEATRPQYWRLTSLDRFDGTVWSSSESFTDADGRLPSRPPEAATSRVRQRFTIFALDTIWAPAALTPVRVLDSTTSMRWNSELATLIVPGSRQSIGAANYTVVSEVPDFRPADLDGQLPRDLPKGVADAIELPGETADLLRPLARTIVATAGPRPYPHALALQNWFRTNFTYDLTRVQSGHDEHAIEAFLRSRRGYCEQFAGTFAAMARSIGIPARVAVGFTWGERDEDGTYTVRGRNAHVWPEVYIPGAGWVAFEPTPGRGQPGAQTYTGVPAEQVAPVDPGTSTTTTSTTLPAGLGGTQDTFPRVNTVEADPTSSGGNHPVPVAITVAAILVALVLVLYLVVLLVVRQRRRLRRHHAHSIPGRVQGAWADVLDALGRRVRVSRADRPRPTVSSPVERLRSSGSTLRPSSSSHNSSPQPCGPRRDPASTRRPRAPPTLWHGRWRTMCSVI